MRLSPRLLIPFLICFFIAVGGIAYAQLLPGFGRTSTGGGAPTGGCAQANTYIAALTAPTTPEKNAYTAAICGMVADGTFALLDGLYIEANTSAANARVNAVNPGTFNLVGHGSCTFTADQGFTGDGTTCYNDPVFVPSTAGGHMTLNSASYGVCVLNSRTTPSSTSQAYGGQGVSATDRTYFYPLFASVISAGALNDAGGGGASNATNAQGSWIASRTLSSGAQNYLNGSPITSTAIVSSALPAATVVQMAGNNNGTLANWTSDQHGYWFFGAGLTQAQVTSIYTRLGNMMFALGNGPCAVANSATNYFFDSVAGADTNNCLTTGTACLTVTKMNALAHYGGGTLQWKGGSSFTGCLALAASTNVTNPGAGPITISQYSTGAAPIITSNCGGANSAPSGPKTAAITLDSINATINGIVVRGSGLVAGSATQYGIALQNSAGILTSNYIVENTDVSGFGVAGLTSGDQGSDIISAGFSQAAGFPNACGFMNVSILNNTLHGSSTTSGENNGFYGLGCGSGQLQTLQGNNIFNISAIANNAGTGNGAYLGQGNNSPAGAGGSYIQFTLAHDIGASAAGTCGGPVGLWAFQTYLALLQFDEVYNVLATGGLPGGSCDFSCYDFDISAYYGLAQYIYGHNCGGPGFVIYNGGLGDVIRYSILENTGSYNEDGGGAFGVGAGSPGSSWQGYNNTIFQNYSPGTSTPPSCLSLGFGGAYAAGLWANNACYNAVQDMFGRTYMVQGNSATGVNTITMVNNDYFDAGGTLTFAAQWPNPTTYATLALLQAGTGQETGSNTITPGFTTPPTGTCTWTPSSTVTWPPSGCPSAYSTLAAGLKSAGANLLNAYAATWFPSPYPTTEGLRDYYANAINPATSGCRNMGAYGVCP
jgi:hypothetical protein